MMAVFFFIAHENVIGNPKLAPILVCLVRGVNVMALKATRVKTLS